KPRSGVPRWTSSSLTLSAATGVSAIMCDRLLSRFEARAPARARSFAFAAPVEFLDADQSVARPARPRILVAHQDAGDQRRLAVHAVVLPAMDAPAHRLARRAHAARLEIAQSLHQLALELLVLRDRGARLFELALEQGTQLVHRVGSALRAPPA